VRKKLISRVKNSNPPRLRSFGAFALLAVAITLAGCCVLPILPDPILLAPYGAAPLILESPTAIEPHHLAFARWTFGEMEATLSIYRYRPSDAVAIRDSLKVDVMIRPKDLADRVNFRPQNVRVVVGTDTLLLGGTDIRDYRCHGFRSFDAYFADQVRAPAEAGADSVWCRVDLSGAFIFDGTPLEFGPITGRIPDTVRN